MIEVRFDYFRFHGRLELKSKYTFLIGDTSIGKTTIYNLLSNPQSHISVTGGYKLIELPGRGTVEDFQDYVDRITPNQRVIFYCDEDVEYITDNTVQNSMQESNALFLIINRDSLGALAYDIEDVQTLKCIQYGNELYYSLEPLYSGQFAGMNPKNCQQVYTEDKRSLNIVCNEILPTSSARGKNQVLKRMKTLVDTLFIVDRTGFGSCIKECYEYLQRCPNNCIYFIESFESILINSMFMQEYVLGLISKHTSLRLKPDEFCANEETFYSLAVNDILQQGVLDNQIHSYNKGRLLYCFLKDCCPTKKYCNCRVSGCKLRIVLGNELYSLLYSIGEKHSDNELLLEDKATDSDGSSLTTHAFH